VNLPLLLLTAFYVASLDLRTTVSIALLRDNPTPQQLQQTVI